MNAKRLVHCRHSYNNNFSPITINIVPYVDVLLVLLVIFIVSSATIDRGIDVDLPNIDGKSMISAGNLPIIVSINQYGQTFLNIASHPQTPLNVQTILLKVRAEQTINPNKTVLLKGDKSTSYGKVAQLMSILQQAGVVKVGLLTNLTT